MVQTRDQYVFCHTALLAFVRQLAQQAQRGPSREGSIRGGLAGIAAKMGSPMDRLRRLSSGHYQQQAAAQQQQHY